MCKLRKESVEILVHFTIEWAGLFHIIFTCDKETWTNTKTQNVMSQNIIRKNFQDLIYNSCIYISCVAYLVEILYSKLYLFFKIFIFDSSVA